VTAPKALPPITGETTLGELEGILRAHGVVDVGAEFIGNTSVCLDGIDWSNGADLAEAFAAALRALRIEQADELDLTDEEARA
jgi:hypothetical protein